MTEERASNATPNGTPPEEDPRPDGLRSAKSLLWSTPETARASRRPRSAWPCARPRLARRRYPIPEERRLGHRRAIDGEPLGIDFQSLGDGFTWDSADLTKDEAEARRPGVKEGSRRGRRTSSRRL